MTTQAPMDVAKMEAFVGRALGDTSGFLAVLMVMMGDRLGLFKDLHQHGPSTAADLAARAGVNARYAREWLGGMANAGYLEYDPQNERFGMPAEHAPVLAQESGPVFLGGIFQELLGTLQIMPRVLEAFRHGGGVPQSAYGDDFWEGVERLTGGWFENFLIPVWIPAVEEMQRALQKGVVLADVGCGAGRAILRMAQEFPASRFVGYDVFEPAIARAKANAETAGVSDRVEFRLLDVVKGLPETYDIITTFDVVHDAADPAGLLGGIRRSLKPGGIYMCLDINCSDKLEENAGPLGVIFHGVSLIYCMTTSLAVGGAGLGTVGLHEKKLRELALEAGFLTVRRVPLQNPFSALYELRI